MLHPAPGLGVHRVSVAAAPSSSGEWLGTAASSPRWRRTLRRVPLVGSRSRITAVRALLSFPLVRSQKARANQLSNGSAHRAAMLRFAEANPHVATEQPADTQEARDAMSGRLPGAWPCPEWNLRCLRSRRAPHLEEQSASRPCSTNESVAASSPWPATKHSFLPWVLVPSEVLLPPLPPGAHLISTRQGVSR